MRYDTIISTGELSSNIKKKHWVVVDCRFDLSKSESGQTEYLEAHIPGAVYAHLDRDLSSPKMVTTGRHPLPDPDRLITLFSSWGIGRGTQVVAYDTTGGSFAGRLWWLLRYYGHVDVAVLDGGFQKWVKEGLPVEAGEVTKKTSNFHPGAPLEEVVDASQALALIDNLEYRLIDARSEKRYRGEEEPIDPVAGHIPGALNRFHGLNLATDGTFLPPETLANQFKTLLGDIPTDHTIVYCGSGVTSIHHLIAMRYAGLPTGRLYLGSWSEWITDPKRPRMIEQ